MATASWAGFVRSEWTQAVALSASRSQATASLVAAHAERSLEIADQLLLGVEQLVSERALRDAAALRGAWTKIRAMAGEHAEIGSAWVLNADGETVLHTASFPPAPGNFADREYFATHRNGARGLLVSPAQTDTLSGRDGFTVSRALVSDDGEFLGVAVVGVYSDYFAERYKIASDRPGMGVSLRLSKDGRLLAGWPSNGLQPETAMRKALLARASRNRSGAVRLADGQTKWIVAWSVLPEQPVVAVARQEFGGALAGWQKTWLWTGIWVIAACVGFSLLVMLGLRSARAIDRKIVERTARLSEALTHNNMLMAEAHHRIKNNLQFVSALILTQAHSASGAAARDQLKDLERRIQAIGRLHERIYSTADYAKVDLPTLLRELCADIGRAADAGDIIGFESREAIGLPIERALPVMMIVNELVTNAIKHGTGPDARVVVRCARKDGELVIEVRDNGPGLPEGFDLATATHFGLKMTRILLKQEGGQLRAVSENNETVFELRVPIRGASRKWGRQSSPPSPSSTAA